MKPTMVAIHAWLVEHGESTAQAVGAHFWPKQSTLGPARGGPSRGATIALRFLGKMQQRGLVAKHCPTLGSSLWSARPAHVVTVVEERQ